MFGVQRQATATCGKGKGGAGEAGGAVWYVKSAEPPPRDPTYSHSCIVHVQKRVHACGSDSNRAQPVRACVCVCVVCVISLTICVCASFQFCVRSALIHAAIDIGRCYDRDQN